MKIFKHVSSKGFFSKIYRLFCRLLAPLTFILQVLKLESSKYDLICFSDLSRILFGVTSYLFMHIVLSLHVIIN